MDGVPYSPTLCASNSMVYPQECYQMRRSRIAPRKTEEHVPHRRPSQLMAISPRLLAHLIRNSFSGDMV